MGCTAGFGADNKSIETPSTEGVESEPQKDNQQLLPHETFLQQFGHKEISFGDKKSTVAEAIENCPHLKGLGEAALQSVVKTVVDSEEQKASQQTETLEEEKEPERPSLVPSTPSRPKTPKKETIAKEPAPSQETATEQAAFVATGTQSTSESSDYSQVETHAHEDHLNPKRKQERRHEDRVVPARENRDSAQTTTQEVLTEGAPYSREADAPKNGYIAAELPNHTDAAPETNHVDRPEYNSEVAVVNTLFDPVEDKAERIIGTDNEVFDDSLGGEVWMPTQPSEPETIEDDPSASLGSLPELNDQIVFGQDDVVEIHHEAASKQPASPEAYLEEVLVFDVSGNVYTSEDREVVAGEESSEQWNDLTQEAEATFEQLVQLLDTEGEELFQLTASAEGEMAITFEFEYETDEYLDEPENVTPSEEAWLLPTETSKEQAEVVPEPPAHLVELIASVTETEETVTLEYIQEQADQQPFEVTLARLALLLERPDDSLPDQLGGLIQQVDRALQGGMEVAENNHNKLHITPETLQSLLVLLYMTGHANPRESLLELVREADLQRLVQTMRYLAQLSNPRERWESVDSPSLAADDADTNHTLRTHIGKLAVMFHKLQAAP